VTGPDGLNAAGMTAHTAGHAVWHRPILRLTLLLVAAGGLLACAAATGAPPADAGAEAGVAAGTAEDAMVPAGYGTLRQDDITLSIRAGALLVKVTPLDESTIRLLASDTYTRLRALRESRLDDAVRGMSRSPELFLVSFFSYEPDVTYQPEDVQLLHQARVLRAASISPVTTGWGRQRLAQQETQMAVYLFEGPADYRQPMTMRYGTLENAEWRQIITRLENERAKILSRVR
jgi:hypothetical protein